MLIFYYIVIKEETQYQIKIKVKKKFHVAYIV